MTIIKIKHFRGKFLQSAPKRFFFETKEFINAMENNDEPKPGEIVLLKTAERRPVTYPEMLDALQESYRKSQESYRKRVEEIKADPFPTIEALEQEVGRMHAIIEAIKSIVWPPVLRNQDGQVQYHVQIEPHIEAKWKLDQIEKILINPEAPTTPET